MSVCTIGAVVEARGDHQRGAAAVIGEIDRRPAVEEQLDGSHPVVLGGIVGMAGGPHQRRQVGVVAPVRIDAGVQQHFDDARRPACGRIEDDAFAGRIDGVGRRAMGDEVFGEGRVGVEGGGAERGLAMRIDRARLGAGFDEQLDDRDAVGERGLDQRRRPFRIGAVEFVGDDRFVRAEQRLDEGETASFGGDGEGGVAHTVTGGGRGACLAEQNPAHRRIPCARPRRGGC